MSIKIRTFRTFLNVHSHFEGSASNTLNINLFAIKNNIFPFQKSLLIYRHFFEAKFQNGLPKIIKPSVTGPKYALKLVITRIWNILPEIITPSVSPQNEYFGVVWITNGSIISYPSNALFKPKTRNNRTICNNQSTQ